MSLELTNLSAFTFSFGPIPYPAPNFNFAYAAGPDGREFLEGDITKYYEANPDDAYYIFKVGSGIDPEKDPLFIVGQDAVGFSEAGANAFDAYPNLYYYQSQIAGFPGSLEANLSLQAFKDYVFQQAKTTANVDFSQSDIDLIEKGFDAVIARYASVLKDDNLMKLGSNLSGSGDGKDYIDMWADIVGVETQDFYNVAPGFTGLFGNQQTNIISAERFDVYSKIFEKATTDGSEYYQWYEGQGSSKIPKFTISDFNVYSQPAPQVDSDGSPTSIVNKNAPTVLQSILGDFKDLLDSGAYTGTFADGGLKIESGVRSLLEAGLDANPLNTGQGFGYSANGSPTAPLGLDSQSILQRIPGYEFSAMNTFVDQYGSPVTTIKPSVAARGVLGPAGVSALNSDFKNGSGFFPEGSAALAYDSFSEWSIEVVTPVDEFVSQDIFPTPENETLQAIQFFKVEFIDAGLYLEMPETPVKTHIILSSNDVSGDIDEEFALDQESPMIQDLSLGLGEGFSNFAGTSVGDDVVMGGNLNDFIAVKDGNDKVMGMDGDDLIDTGAGYDIAFLGSGSDTILVRHESMKGELAPVSYLTLPDFSSEDVIALEEGIGFEVIDDLRLRLSYEDYEKVVVLSGSSTLKADDLGVLSSSVGWQDIIDMGQIHTI